MSDTGIKEDELTEQLREDNPYDKARQIQQQRFDEQHGSLVVKDKTKAAPASSLPPEKVGATVTHFATNLRRLLRDNPERVDEIRAKAKLKKGA